MAAAKLAAGIAIVVALTAGAIVPGAAQPRPAASSVPSEVMRLLDSIKAADSGQLSISEEDGRFLRILAATTNTKHTLEINNTYSYNEI